MGSSFACSGMTYATGVQPVFQGPVPGITPDNGLLQFKIFYCDNGKQPTNEAIGVSATGFTAVSVTWGSAIDGVRFTRGDGTMEPWYKTTRGPPGINPVTVQCPPGMLMTALTETLPYSGSGAGKVFGNAWYVGMTCRYGEKVGQGWISNCVCPMFDLNNLRPPVEQSVSCDNTRPVAMHGQYHLHQSALVTAPDRCLHRARQVRCRKRAAS